MPILPNGIPIYKTSMRHHMKEQRAELGADERARASQIACEILGAWLQKRAETRIAIYLATPHELNLDSLVTELLRAGKIVCAPRLTPATSKRRFVRLHGLSAVKLGTYKVREPISGGIILCPTPLDEATTINAIRFARSRNSSAVKRSSYDVREPIPDEIVRPEIALVPGLAFDKMGGRLGMGGGWYDRVLGEVPLKVGVCFGEQIVDDVPVEAHDVRMNWLASEAGVWRIA